MDAHDALDLEAACQEAVRAARLAGNAILEHFRAGTKVDDKGGRGFDPVTEADRAAERAIRDTLASVYPDHGFAGEEYGTLAGAGRYEWHIDPIDGTRSFIMGQLHWGSLLALADRGNPVLGLMHQPYTDETFFASRGAGAWLERGNRTRLRTRRCADLGDALAAATSEDMFSPVELESVRRVFGQSRLMRWSGDCYNYCLLAAGHIDLVIEASLSPYDILALVPIIEEAGGVVTTWEGAPVTGGGRVVAAGDPALHEAVLEILQE